VYPSDSRASCARTSDEESTSGKQGNLGPKMLTDTGVHVLTAPVCAYYVVIFFIQLPRGAVHVSTEVACEAEVNQANA
jgi:hypothetical protein